VYKGIILAITGSLLVFVIIFAVIFYIQPDFDQQLIEQVDNGVPAEKLIPQIDQETEKLNKNAKKRLLSAVLTKNFGNGDLASKSDYQSNTEEYENEMKMISVYDDIQKKFAKRKITKEQFLQEIKVPKSFIKMMN
jgi:hypothetical protein